MPRLRYIATDDPTDNVEVEAFGETFVKGEAKTVSAELYAKLKDNPTFEPVTRANAD